MNVILWPIDSHNFAPEVKTYMMTIILRWIKETKIMIEAMRAITALSLKRKNISTFSPSISMTRKVRLKILTKRHWRPMIWK